MFTAVEIREKLIGHLMVSEEPLVLMDESRILSYKCIYEFIVILCMVGNAITYLWT